MRSSVGCDNVCLMHGRGKGRDFIRKVKVALNMGLGSAEDRVTFFVRN